MERREVRHGRKQRLGCALQPHVAIRRQISSVSTAGGTYVCHVICFHPPGPPGFGRTLPQDTFVFCVVRRDRDGDAVISGLDFSSTSTQLTSLPLSFFFFFVSVYLAICLCRGERELQKGLKCHGSGSGRREGVEGGRERERERERSCLPCSLGDSALASLQFTCTGLPKAAASQATVPKLASHWMGGALLAPRAAQRRSIGLQCEQAAGVQRLIG